MRDYVTKTGFGHGVIGLSGGIDSALVAAIACDALGPTNVTGVTMPSPFSSGGTRRDAARLARNLGIEFMRLPITPVFVRYRRVLAKAFKGVKEDVTEENLQARIRGNYLMALSSSGPGRRTRTRCRPIPSSTPSSRRMSRATRASLTSWPEDSTRRRSSG
jgi:NAD+ synthetase